MENYYEISPDEYLDLLKFSDYQPDVITRIRQFEGKKLHITGDLSVKNLKIDTLGNVGKISGRLDISYTDIGDVSDIDITRYVTDYGSKRHKLRLAAIEREKRNEMDEKKSEGEWDRSLGDDMEEDGILANAILDYLDANSRNNVMNDEENEKLKRLKQNLNSYNEELKNKEDAGEDTEDLEDLISSVENEIEEIESDYISVYSLYPTDHDHYGMKIFELLGTSEEYAIIDENKMDDAVEEYAKSYVDDVGISGIAEWILEDCMDDEQVKREIEEFYDNDVRDNWDAYFDSDDLKLTDEQEERQEELESYIDEMEDLKSELEDEQKDLEDYDSEEYLELDEKIKEVESNIETAQKELDDIEPLTEPTEEMLQDKIDSLVNDRSSDLKGWLDELGMDYKNYIDTDCVAEKIVQHDGWGIISSYDGNYDTVDGIDGQTYVIIRYN